MAEQDEDISEEDVAGEEDAPKKRRIAGKTLVIYVVLPLLLLGGGGAGAYFMGLLDGGEMDGGEVEIVRAPTSFYDMPELLVNLSERDGTRSQYLKLRVSLEMSGEEARQAVEPVLPRIIDMFHVYLRELRASDLDGSAGIYRLKEELIRRVNMEVRPVKVSDVLFKEIIIQ